MFRIHSTYHCSGTIFYVPGVPELVGVVGSVCVPEPHVEVIISIGIVPEGVGD